VGAWHVGAVLAAAALLRALRVPLRWDEVSWLYAAYPAHVAEALADGRLADALQEWVGLHPPLFGLLHGVMEIAAPIPLLWLAFSAACSLGAVALIARQSPLAGLLLATSPIQIAYAAEINDYPLVALEVAAIWVGRERAVGTGRWALLAAAVALAAWTHALAGAVGGIALLTLPLRVALRVGGVLALTCLPLTPGVLGVLGEPGSFRQPPFKPALVAADFVERYGLWALAWVPLVLLGARRAPALAIGGALSALVIAGLVAVRIAAPHQFPYLLVLGPPAALLVAAACATPNLQRAAVTLATLQGAWVLAGDAGRVQTLIADPSGRAIDAALDLLEEPWTCGGAPHPDCAGDALYLLAPAGLNDDDKRRFSPVLWRLPPWRPMPMVKPYAFDYADHRHGQPRLVDGHVVYVADGVRAPLAQARQAHPRLLLVVYEQGQRAAFTTGLAARLGVSPREVGADLLFELQPLPQEPLPTTTEER